ncbi:sucrase-isomaltase, intestinal-like [Amblyomma americanum]
MAGSLSSAASIKYWERKLVHRELYKTTGSIAGVLILIHILCVLCALALPLLLEVYILPRWAGLKDPCNLDIELRVNCESVINAKDITEEVCKAAGCCWTEENKGYCYHRFPTCFQYKIQDSNSTSQVNLGLNLHEDVNDTLLRSIAKNIVFRRTQWSRHHVQLQIFESSLSDKTDAEEPLFKAPKYQAEDNITNPEYDVKYTDTEDEHENKQVFHLNVKRRSYSSRSVLNTKLGTLIITEDVLELTVVLPSHNLYGLGLRSSTSLHHDMPSKWTLVRFTSPPTLQPTDILAPKSTSTLEESERSQAAWTNTMFSKQQSPLMHIQTLQ